MTELLVKKRSFIKAKATRFKTFLDSCGQDGDKVIEIVSRLEKFELVWNEYEEVQTKIEELDEEQSKDREIFENSES